MLLSELLRKKDDYVNNKFDGKCMIPSTICSMKVLIVLDDIDHSDHLEYLAGDLDWFGNGSRVVITTRNRQLIENDDAIYEVSTLPDHEAMLLFNRHAFKKKIPDECFKMFSLEVVNHAKGLPLALKVRGSLFHGKGLTQWRRIVDKIKDKSTSEIVEKIKISYDGLEARRAKDVPGYDDSLEMHDLIEDMGRFVVKMQKDLGEPSRIWDVEDFEEVMMNNAVSRLNNLNFNPRGPSETASLPHLEETKAMESIWLHDDNVKKLRFSKEVMKNMKRLELLCIYKFDTHDAIDYLPNSLAWIDIFRYPWESLPEEFEPKKLVHLYLYREYEARNRMNSKGEENQEHSMRFREEEDEIYRRN
ncbi:hypothetical protein CQW23_27512 [Capsicum baccatum]|uniref:NB-ARC domain-containing protein n=1 Tax=Capsicum baccatum TaxID=33114 RepID=A0A2G2VDW3_CAPBA|nr:hypothetical protein CQW23_27512 [Capsicum baccatum]